MDEPRSFLDSGQRARVEALNVSHALLSSRTKGSSGVFSATPSSSQQLPQHRDVSDLVEVAHYVITGTHHIVNPVDDDS